MPLLLILALIIGLPLIEVYLLIEVGSVIGALPTIGLAILTAVAGTALVRHQGFGVLRRIQQALARDEVPALELLDGALILVAGFFLLLPGFLTDCAGLLLLIPPLRRFIVRRYVRFIPVHPQSPGGGSGVIEGEFRRIDRERLR